MILIVWQIRKIIYKRTLGFPPKEYPEQRIMLSKKYKDKRQALQECYELNQHAILNPHTVRYEIVEV